MVRSTSFSHVCESACGRHIVEESAVELPIISVIHREGNDLHSAGECEMLRRAILHTTMRAPKRERVECSGLAVVSPFPVFPLFPVSVANDHTRSASDARDRA